MYFDDPAQDPGSRTMGLLRHARDAAGAGPINVLALSGGGGGIAFGAGALTGWTRAGTRPEFQVVTGVSAGALLAPFAFLGPKYDGLVTEAFSGARTEHLLQSRWIDALFGASVYQGKPLRDLVDYYVTPDLMRAIAAEYETGRLLIVATTDLDSKRTVIWDMGRIAAEGGERGRELFRDVLVASASIPGVLPPVLIQVEESGTEFDEMHVDGGTTAPFIIVPGTSSLSSRAMENLRGANVYVIVNGQLGGSALTTPVRTVSIVKRGVDAALESSSRAAVEVALSVSNQAGMTLRISEIPDDYPYGGSLDMRPAKIGALFNFGVRCGLQRKLWGSAAQALSQNPRSRAVPQSRPTDCPARQIDDADGSEGLEVIKADGAAAIATLRLRHSDGDMNRNGESPQGDD